ncbi:MAG: histone deacetylase family protein [Pikeienuella sp.]
MTLIIVSHPECLEHVTPSGHPERADRLKSISKVLEYPIFKDAVQLSAPLAFDESIMLAHPSSYVQSIINAAPDSGVTSLDPDTHMSPGSLNAARRAAGANVMAVDHVMTGKARAAFCATRPPGHHAEKTSAMGFCLFANASIAALHALANHGVKRVAIADFDVHHGNGTQDVVWDDPRICFCSSHQSPLYPGTGMEHETGAGNIHNATLPPMSGGAAFRAAWRDKLLPAIDAHKPDLIVISAGFDAHADDPLANLNLVEDDFAWITQELCDLANKHCDGRVVSTLEGGYSLSALSDSTAAHVKVLLEHSK